MLRPLSILYYTFQLILLISRIGEDLTYLSGQTLRRVPEYNDANT